MRPDQEELFKRSLEELLSESGPLDEIKWHIAFYKIMQQLDSSIDELRISMQHSADSSDHLAQRVHRLNIVLTWATIFGSIAAAGAATVAVIQLL